MSRFLQFSKDISQKLIKGNDSESTSTKIFNSNDIVRLLVNLASRLFNCLTPLLFWLTLLFWECGLCFSRRGFERAWVRNLLLSDFSGSQIFYYNVLLRKWKLYWKFLFRSFSQALISLFQSFESLNHI